MAMRYDDALPALIRVAKAADIDLSANGTIVLRDAAGRLGIAFAGNQSSDRLVTKLRAVLGAYALAEPVLPSLLFKSLEAVGPRDVAISMGDQEFVWIRLVDRRIVGADWLSNLEPPPAGPPRLVFGSLKGGVGRSTALSVLATDLARHGKRVLCIDLDLEAPGLGTMLLRGHGDDDRRPKYGALDYLVENGLDGISADEIYDFIGLSHLNDGYIHVLPAVGRITDEHPENMIGKLARGLVEDIGPAGRQPLTAQLREMVDRIVDHGDYDAVLVDARAGLAEITAGTWLGLGARKLLLFGVNQLQTFQGYRYVLSHLVQTLGVLDVAASEDWRTRLAFVHSKAPSSGEGRLRFRDRLYELCAATLYDAEDEPGSDSGFNWGFDETGTDVPHDATFIAYHPDYDAFEPLEDGTALRQDVYCGPYGAFLQRAWHLLDWERPE